MATSGAIEPASLTLADARLSMRTPDDATIAAMLTTKSPQSTRAAPSGRDGAAPRPHEGSDLRGQRDLGPAGAALPELLPEAHLGVGAAERAVEVAGPVGGQSLALLLRSRRTRVEPSVPKCPGHATSVTRPGLRVGEEIRDTYGTGNFMLLNTGTEPILSKNGLLTTVCYKIGAQPTVYALEGSIAVTGSLVRWLRDNLGMISSAPEIEQLAATVDDNGGAYFVPAFSGLFAPYWRSDARGALVGLTRYVNKGHIARAALEATAFQTREVLDAMNADSGVDLTEVKVDGGMVGNETLMQFQADILGVPVIRPKVAETTALGAAYAAGIAVGFWSGEQDVIDNWAEDKRWVPSMDHDERDRQYRLWKKAITRTFDWVDDDVQ